MCVYVYCRDKFLRLCVCMSTVEISSLASVCAHSLPVSSPFSCSPHSAVPDGLCEVGWSGDVSVPLQLPSLHCSQEIFMSPDDMLDPKADLNVGYVVRV